MTILCNHIWPLCFSKNDIQLIKVLKKIKYAFYLGFRSFKVKGEPITISSWHFVLHLCTLHFALLMRFFSSQSQNFALNFISCVLIIKNHEVANSKFMTSTIASSCRNNYDDLKQIYNPIAPFNMRCQHPQPKMSLHTS
jgi:hypothetical protein